MTKDFKESYRTVIVYEKFSLPLTLSAFKKGICVSSRKIINPNNGVVSLTVL